VDLSLKLPTTAVFLIVAYSFSAAADPASTRVPATPADVSQKEQQTWNWHVQNTDIVQYHPDFHSSYSGPNSLNMASEVKETVSLDILFGLRLWEGAEFHLDGLMWQGFGLSNTRGIDGFPNGEAFRLGTDVPNVNLSRVFIRQIIGLGGEEEIVSDDPLQLAGSRQVSRITLTMGRMSAKDIFDNNAYANDPRTQFMNWALMANEAWDYPGDSLGYISGFAAELNQPKWALRYGFFQMPSAANGTSLDDHFAEAWGMVTELEFRYAMLSHPGTVRLLGFLNQAHMGSYQQAIDNSARPADITATRAYRYKFGVGLNFDQQLTKNIGAFSRLGWSDGEKEAWVFSDVDRTATLGVSIKGEAWRRPNDTIGIAGVLNGLSRVHKEFLAEGGTGILAGDGTLTYGLEEIIEAYYDFQIWKTIHVSLDYQFVNHPAFNTDRGPVSIFGARIHWAL
jgi:high affinity Mn2+ porin